MISWHPRSIVPDRRRPILMRGPSGYIAPHDVAYVSGYYDAEYRPLDPWQTSQSDSVQEGHPPEFPSEWCYVSDLEGRV